GADERGLRFFTNRESEKGKHLARDRRAAIAFHFTTTGVQLRFEGEAFPLNDEESDIYFRERPRESQIGAWASKQSQILESWEALIQQYHEFSRHFEGKEVGRPPQWGGYRLEVKRAEYWLEGMYRLHKRVRFERTPDGWVKNWLYP
ncbi:MAG: pyridoxal 5'-phosphate synthase, partial [Sandaracinaceae bacterium]|nr:pyridoxal 5'-phosphate synthase [Sandaracinaceae bacterium]